MPKSARMRSDRRGPGGRTGREWAARGALAMGFLLVGIDGTISSLANAVAKVDSARAYALAPDNGVILAKYAEDAFSRRPSGDPQSLPARLARSALLADATAADALTVLGLQAQLRQDTARAEAFFQYSSELSRRELRPRIWAIEESVSRGDIPRALRNYDIALRTSRDAAEVLYPVLGAALSERRIRSELLRILATRPIWTEEFLDHVARRGIEPLGVIALLAEGKAMGLQANDDIRAHLVNALIVQGEPMKAWAYYRSFRPNATRDRSRDPEFAQSAKVRTVFDWNVADDPRLSAALLADGTGGLLDFALPPNAGGVLLRQTQILSPGTYRLQGRSRNLEQPESSRPYWSLSCADGRELGRIALPNSTGHGGRFSGSFIVPAGCSVQTLSLTARPTDDIMGVSGQIEEAQLVRLRGAE